MADTKISALTAATTPLAGTEILPIVQSGTTKQVSVANLTAGRAVSADSLTLTNALTAANGGTGQSSYAVGDLLYASTTTALSKLAGVATGNALISGGVGVAPSWGKIGLTTHISGTLATGNGGTGLTSFTANGVIYASSTSALTTGSALTFDGTNFATTGTASATKFIPTGGTATGNGMYLPAANTLAFSTNGAEAMRIISTGRVGVTAGQNPLGRFEVADGASLTTAGAWASATFAAKQVGGFINDLSQIVFGYHAGTQTYGSAYFGFLETNQGGNGYGDIVCGTRAVNTDTQPTERWRVTSGGSFLIGQTTGVGAKLEVGGYTNAYASSTGLGVLGNSEFQNNLRIAGLAGVGSRTVTADANGTLSASSDSSLKKEVVGFEVSGLDALMKVEPKAYRWLSDIAERGEEAAVEFGFFADRVAPIIPSAAPKDKNGLYGFYDRAMIAVITKSVQQQQAIIESLTNRISSLETSKG